MPKIAAALQEKRDRCEVITPCEFLSSLLHEAVVLQAFKIIAAAPRKGNAVMLR